MAAILDGGNFFRTVWARPNDHQGRELFFLKADTEMQAIDPDVDIVAIDRLFRG